MKITPVKGMPDFYPENQEIIEYIQNKWQTIGQNFGYKNYEGPILEPIELYLEKTSEEIVKEQTFIVNDKKGNQLVLRPELTPTLARMIVKKEYELNLPIRWQSFGRFFRYEKPQKGRNRSFYQWNIDLIGEDNITSDLEILEIAVNSLKSLGLSSDQVKIKFSNRSMIQNFLRNKLNLEDKTISFILRIIDRLDKRPIEYTKESLKDLKLSNDDVNFIIDFFLTDDTIIEDEWLKKIIYYLKEINIFEYFEFDKKIIRGFDYYTGLVFEAWPKADLKRAIFGGGRYNNLTQTVGGKRQLPGVGFAVGDAAIIEVLKEFKLLPVVQKSKILFIPMNEESFIESKKIIINLQKSNIITQINNDYTMKLKSSMKFADKENFTYAVIVGSNEIANGIVKVKDLKTFKEQDISIYNLVNYFEELM